MARWGRGKNRAFGHVHNWQIRMANADNHWSIDPASGWYGTYIDRWWECIRGGEVKHITPSVDYPLPTGLYGRKGNEDFPASFSKRVFLAASGYDYHAHDTY